MPEPPAPRAQLGILFVHGIGQQTKAETLVNWLDPLAGWISASLLGAQPAKFPVPQTPLCHVSAAGLRSTGDGAPPHAEVHMRDPRQHTSSHWLVAEAFWAECFPSPTTNEVAEWLLKTAPNTILLHFGLNVRRAWKKWLDSKRPAVKVVAAGGLIRAVGLLLMGSFVILPLLLAALFLLMLIRLLPIPVLPDAILKQVQLALAAVIGDSMVFCASPTRLAAIVRETRAAMDWLEPRCERMAIVAHSQGAAVVRHAISGEDDAALPPPANLCGVVTLGAGLRKLGILMRIASLSGLGDRGDSAIHGINSFFIRGLVLATLLGLVFHASGILRMNWGLLATFAVLTGFNNLLYALLNFEEVSPAEEWWRGVLAKSPSDAQWLDLYASHDPVSNGAIWDEASVTNATTREIRNGGSFASDHTAYWRNKADFLARVAGFLSLVGKCDVPLHALADGDAVRLEDECRQRRARHAFVRGCWLFIAATLVWIAVAMQDTTEVRCFGENVRSQLAASSLQWLHWDLDWLKAASGKQVAWGVFAALLLLWRGVCGWLRRFGDGMAAAELANHRPADINTDVGIGLLAAIMTLLAYISLAMSFGLPLGN